MQPLLNFFKPFCKQFYGPLLWTAITLVLLCLPGDSVPGQGMFNVPHLDKIVHILLFGGIVVSWGLYTNQRYKKAFILLRFICGISILIGVVMEFVQVNFIPMRSFDVWDIVADFVGSVVAYYWVVRDVKK